MSMPQLPAGEQVIGLAWDLFKNTINENPATTAMVSVIAVATYVAGVRRCPKVMATVTATAGLAMAAFYNYLASATFGIDVSFLVQSLVPPSSPDSAYGVFARIGTVLCSSGKDLGCFGYTILSHLMGVDPMAHIVAV